MLYITIISVLAALLFLTRLFFIKREIKRVTMQLNQFNHKQTEKKVDLAFFETDLEKLASEINRQIDSTMQAQAEKQRTENELKQAIANISHDIRTPMTSILGYIQLLESADIDPEQRTEYTTIVKKGALRLKVLLEDFFELSVIESADYPLNIESIKLNQIVPEVLVGFYEAFYQRGLEPIIHLPEEEVIIKADVSAVKRVIENLLSNALKHSTGNVIICLEKRRSSVELTISNPAGCLTEKDLFFLFDRFYKADQTRIGKGTGLGLSIAKGLMKKMNGNLTAELQEEHLMMKCEWKI
ncbi:HAMP domain-containing sensor histidine kinase [Neobacillus sp. OS1-2]|uniref:sensor histidine kinase n=1 Tax=Neobacillus sp. OS1-2 TaxID=3070680 RepID=UPI0027DEEC6C|nr:HAMP domain-containing sensor histidine kinase [Neobacillus sp. OS1-2]WML42101.1 HAMP domain-containing sensor histidine kinase [Neobacillus sp. OS1-2]